MLQFSSKLVDIKYIHGAMHGMFCFEGDIWFINTQVYFESLCKLLVISRLLSNIYEIKIVCCWLFKNTTSLLSYYNLYKLTFLRETWNYVTRKIFQALVIVVIVTQKKLHFLSGA